jgi:hypothetical protein
MLFFFLQSSTNSLQLCHFYIVRTHKMEIVVCYTNSNIWFHFSFSVKFIQHSPLILNWLNIVLENFLKNYSQKQFCIWLKIRHCPVGRFGTSGRREVAEKGDRRVNTVQKLCTYACKCNNDTC